jgi:hypothetical protein
MEAAMRTARPALPVLIAFALLGAPALSLAAPLASANGEQVGCPEQGAEAVDAETAPQQKSVAAKRGAARDAGKSRQTTPYRSGDAPSRGAPRWHRFLPGMFR